MEITPEFVLQWHRELNQVIPGQPVSIESFLELLPVVSELPPLPPATRVLVRGDVDAGIRNETVINGTRLQSMLQTLRYGIEKGWVQVIIGHRGRDPELSLEPVCRYFEEVLSQPITFIRDWVQEDGTIPEHVVELIRSQSSGSIVILENTRRYAWERAFWKASSEELDSQAVLLARTIREIAEKIAEVFVHEAISASNPDVSSSLIPAAMKHVALGFYIDREFRKHVVRARAAELVVFSGLKIEKLSDLESIIRRGKVRMVIAAGSLAMALKKAEANLMHKTFCMGKAEDPQFKDEKFYIPSSRIQQAEQMLQDGKKRGVEFVLPIDFVLQDETIAETIGPDGQQLDIGPESIAWFRERLEAFIGATPGEDPGSDHARVAFHNGVFGMFEDPRFERGTRSFVSDLKRLNDHGIEVYVGGGEGGSALEKYGDPSWVTHVFTAGGTILKALGDASIPYLKAMWLSRRCESTK